MVINYLEFVLVFLFALFCFPIAFVYIGWLGVVFSFFCVLLMTYIAFIEYDLRSKK